MKKYILLFSLSFIAIQIDVDAQIVGPTSICMNAANTYSISTVASNYNWYTTPGSIATISDPSVQNPDITLTSSVAQYTLTVVTSAPTSTLTAVIVNNTPAAPNAVGGTICDGNTASLPATGTGTLNWYTAATGGTSIFTGSPYVTPALSSTTTYYVEDTYAGCPSLTRSAVTVSVNPLPVINITGANAICNGANTVLTAATVSGGPIASYAWTPGGFTTQSITVSPSTTTTYTISVVNTNGCANSFFQTVTVNPLPVMDTVPNFTGCGGSQYMIPFTCTPMGSFTWTNDNSNFNSGIGISGGGSMVINAVSTLSIENTIISVTPHYFGCTGSPYTFTITINPNANISGTATSTSGVFSGDAYLLQYNAAQLAFDTIQNTALGSNQYTFYAVPAGNYLLKVVPDTAGFPDIVPTYYGNTFEWDSATVINHGCAADFTADITMVEVLNTVGTNFLSGEVIEGDGFGTRINGTNHVMVPGGPLKGIDVKLGKNPAGSGIQARAMTDSTGHYEFDSIPSGDYNIYVDIPGLPMDSSYHLFIGLTDTVTALTYYADSNSVFPLWTVGMKDLARATSNLQLFPNPAKQNVKLRFESQKGTAELQMTDMQARILFTEELKNLPAGQHELQLNLDGRNIPAGVYLLRLSTDTATSVRKLVITD